MGRGRIEFGSQARGQWTIRLDDNHRAVFTAADLIGLKPDDVKVGLEVEFDLDGAECARRVRRPGTALVAPQPIAVFPSLQKGVGLLNMLSAPEDVRSCLSTEVLNSAHLGLRLDRFLIPACDQEQQKQRLRDVARLSQTATDSSWFDAVLLRRDVFLRQLGIEPWPRITSGPLTLHLARASVLENAGLCLHPVHGFAYLPGSGLKGLARAFATTVANADSREVEAVFGRAATESEAGSLDSSGCIVFHDAWPAAWPRLIVDIVNNHHQRYYQGDDSPGDWEEPSMVYFLAVPPGQRFSFALGKRRDDVPDALLKRAREWLDGGLTDLGCGAKTATGYGYFEPASPREANAASQRRAEISSTLRLLTPAFLAGADQLEDDCDLRPATLRGLLRWWWRTLHAGYLDVKQLRALEGVLWGDTESGATIGISLGLSPSRRPRPFSYKDRDNPNRSRRYDPSPEFREEHRLRDRPDQKTTQGLFYLAYGMDDKPGAPPRFHLDPGTTWPLRIQARERSFGERSISAAQALEQARAALWLLSTYGGVGSKARKGFGSLHVPGLTMSLADCEALAATFRAAVGLDAPFDSRNALSPALANRLEPLEILAPTADPWKILDEVGFAYQAFAKSHAHDADKLALGLPRQIHGPKREPTPGQTPAKQLRTKDGLDRHASPIHLHVGLAADRRALVVRVLALPSHRLPDPTASATFLGEFLADFEQQLRALFTPPGGTRPATPVPAEKKIEKSHYPIGRLARKDDLWTVVFSNDSRDVRLSNPERVPPGSDGKSARFYIVAANKHGITARYEELA